MEPAEAFKVGYLTSMVGVPLRGVELMNLVGKHATGGFAKALDAQINGFRAHNAETVQNVLRVEAVLAKHNLPKPVRPQTVDQWVTWADQASQSAGGAVSSDSPAAAALIAGGYYGDLLAAVQLMEILVGLRADAPDDKELAAQIEGHRKHATHAADQIDQVLRHPALSAKAKPPLEAAVAAYRGLEATPSMETLAKLTAAINSQGSALASAF
jgi:ferritin-like metal-binding protein YciE